MKIIEILKLKDNDYTLLKCKKCGFKVYISELKMFNSCGQCGSKRIEVTK